MATNARRVYPFGPPEYLKVEDGDQRVVSLGDRSHLVVVVTLLDLVPMVADAGAYMTFTTERNERHKILLHTPPGVPQRYQPGSEKYVPVGESQVHVGCTRIAVIQQGQATMGLRPAARLSWGLVNATSAEISLAVIGIS